VVIASRKLLAVSHESMGAYRTWVSRSLPALLSSNVDGLYDDPRMLKGTHTAELGVIQLICDGVDVGPDGHGGGVGGLGELCLCHWRPGTSFTVW